MKAKPIDLLTLEDLRDHPVWQFVSEDSASDETRVLPVEDLPTHDLGGRVVATQVLLANGERQWAFVGNINVKNPKFTEHFKTISVIKDGRLFTLARYFDPDHAERGPEALAELLGLTINEVFPISYDVRQHVKGDEAALSGRFLRDPQERLSRAQIIAMAVPRRDKSTH